VDVLSSQVFCGLFSLEDGRSLYPPEVDVERIQKVRCPALTCFIFQLGCWGLTSSMDEMNNDDGIDFLPRVVNTCSSTAFFILISISKKKSVFLLPYIHVRHLKNWSQ